MKQRTRYRPQNPENLESVKSMSKVGFLEIRKVGQKQVKIRFFSTKTYFLPTFDLFLTYFPRFPETLLLTYFSPILNFWGFGACSRSAASQGKGSQTGSLKQLAVGSIGENKEGSEKGSQKGFLDRERKISPKFFRPKFFHGRPRGISVPKCLFFQDLEGLTDVFGRMSAGISGQKLPLWAEFPFLIRGVFERMRLFCLQLEASCLQWSFFTYS